MMTNCNINIYVCIFFIILIVCSFENISYAHDNHESLSELCIPKNIIKEQIGAESNRAERSLNYELISFGCGIILTIVSQIITQIYFFKRETKLEVRRKLNEYISNSINFVCDDNSVKKNIGMEILRLIPEVNFENDKYLNIAEHINGVVLSHSRGFVINKNSGALLVNLNRDVYDGLFCVLELGTGKFKTAMLYEGLLLIPGDMRESVAIWANGSYVIQDISQMKYNIYNGFAVCDIKINIKSNIEKLRVNYDSSSFCAVFFCLNNNELNLKYEYGYIDNLNEKIINNYEGVCGYWLFSKDAKNVCGYVKFQYSNGGFNYSILPIEKM